MGLSKKKIVFTILGLIFIGLIWYCYSWLQKDFHSSAENKVTINFGSKDKQIFLRANVWGVSGNHNEIVLSESNKSTSDKEVDYIFYTSQLYYKIDSNNLIKLYAPKSSISEPLKSFSKITVIINSLESSEEINDLQVNYKKYGLEKISVYN